MREQKRIAKENLITDDGELRFESPLDRSASLTLSLNKRKRHDSADDHEPDPLVLCLFFWSVTLGYPLALYGFMYAVNDVLLGGGSTATMVSTALLGLVIGAAATGHYWQRSRFVSYGLIVGITVAVLLMLYYVFVGLVIASLNHGLR